MNNVLTFPVDTFTPIQIAARQLERCTELVRLAHVSRDEVLMIAALNVADIALNRIKDLRRGPR